MFSREEFQSEYGEQHCVSHTLTIRGIQKTHMVSFHEHRGYDRILDVALYFTGGWLWFRKCRVTLEESRSFVEFRALSARFVDLIESVREGMAQSAFGHFRLTDREKECRVLPSWLHGCHRGPRRKKFQFQTRGERRSPFLLIAQLAHRTLQLIGRHMRVARPFHDSL